MLKVKILPLALADIQEIWFYTYRKWSHEQAHRYSIELDGAIDVIARDPNKGKNIDYVKKGYWRYKIKHHYIFYKKLKSEIRVIRVLHEKMDIVRYLH